MVSLCSFVQWNRVETNKVYLIYQSLSVQNLKYLNKIEKFLGIKISRSQIDISNIHLKEIGHLNYAAYLRLFIPEVVKEDKVLYLDADTIVMSNLGNEFQEMYNCIELIGACPELNADGSHLDLQTYYNTGVLILNIEKLKRTNFRKICFNTLETHWAAVKYADQCIINKAFSERIQELPTAYNFQRKLFEGKSIKNLQNSSIRIVHFTSSDKPWHLHKSIFGQSLYWKYRLKLPGGILFLGVRASRALGALILPKFVIRLINAIY